MKFKLYKRVARYLRNNEVLCALVRRYRSINGPGACSLTFFGSCADVPTELKQTLGDTGSSVSDSEGHYDMDGMSYNPDDGVIASADPKPLILTVHAAR